MRSWSKCSTLLFAVLVTSGCHRKEGVTARYWPSDSPGALSPRVFPERAAGGSGEFRVGNPVIGVCFSGGGTRAAASALGQLRGLHETGLIRDVTHLSAVSGGGWAVTPYTFLPRRIDDAAFLGPYVAPGDLTFDHFRSGRGQIGLLGLAVQESEFATWVEMFVRVVLSGVRIRESDFFGRELGRIFLRPFGLNDPSRFVAQDAAAVRDIIARNPHLNERDFILPREGRPFLILGGTIRRYDPFFWQFDRQKNKRFPIEMTPLYVGVPRLTTDVGESGRSIGGTYVETFAYGAVALKVAPDDTVRGALRTTLVGGRSRRFTLRDMLAVTGAAPAEVALLQRFGFPTFHHWTVHNGAKINPKEYPNTDGGHIENLGIMPLLARRVPYVIAFVNSQDEGVPQYVKNLFGLYKDDPDGWQDWTWNHEKVFDHVDGSRLIEQVDDRLKNGRQAFVLTEHTISRSTVDPKDPFNLRLAPAEQYPVKIAWFFLDKRAWIRKIGERNKSLSSWLDDEGGQFRNLPHLHTFLENSWYVIDLTFGQAAAQSHLTSWDVVSRDCEIRSFFNLQPDVDESDQSH